MINSGLKATVAGLLALGASGCMSMGGYGSGYGDGYYNDGYGGDYAYNDRCYDAYNGYDNYYSQYDCYDRNDYNSRFSVNIGFGGGWWNDFYYPGYGYYMFDRYGARRALYGNYARYWGGRRAGYRWTHNGGHRDGYRGGYRRDHDDRRDGRRGDRRDRSGIGGQIVDRVDRAVDQSAATPRAQREQIERSVDRDDSVRQPSSRPRRQILDRIDRANQRPVDAIPQGRAPDRPARAERAPSVQSEAPARPQEARPDERRSSRGRVRQDMGQVRPD